MIMINIYFLEASFPPCVMTRISSVYVYEFVCFWSRKTKIEKIHLFIKKKKKKKTKSLFSRKTC